MMASSPMKAWKIVKPHIPLIKFRKGRLSSEANKRSPVGQAVTATAKGCSVSRPVLESYQLPKKYQRKPLTEQEIEYINRGGPE